MEKRVSKIIFLSFIATMFLLPMVSATGFFTFKIGNWQAGEGLNTLLGATQIQTGQQFLIFLAIFMIIFVGFSDIIAGFSPLSETVAWVIGFGLAVITASTGVLAEWAFVLFNFAALFGVFAIFLIIFAAFAFIIAAYLGFGTIAANIHSRIYAVKVSKQAMQGAADVNAAIEGLKKIKKSLTG